MAALRRLPGRILPPEKQDFVVPNSWAIFQPSVPKPDALISQLIGVYRVASRLENVVPEMAPPDLPWSAAVCIEARRFGVL
jgi:hypothetical protein